MTPLDPVAVKLHRRGSGPPLVLLHCLGVDHGIWDIAAAGLERSFSVLSIDFPGHGATPAPSRGYGIAELSELVAAVLDREKVGRAHVGGISLGGLVAQQFAHDYQSRVDRLILMDTTARYTDEARANWAVRAAAARRDGVASLIPALMEIWFTPAFVAAEPPAVRYVRSCFERCSGEGYALACEALAAAELRPLAPSIRAPTLVVCGKEDVPPFLAAARWLAETIPDARIAWLAPARHCSVLEQPQEFAREVAAFLA